MTEEGGTVDSPDLPEPHPGDPWHPAWDEDDAGDAARSAAAVQRIADEVRKLTEDDELRTTMEAGAAGRRMIEQIQMVDPEGLSQLAWPSDPTTTDDRVARSGGEAVPESTASASRRWLGRLRRRGVPTGTTADEEDPGAVVDEQGDEEVAAAEAPRDAGAPGPRATDDALTDDAPAVDPSTDEAPTEAPVDALDGDELDGDEDDFPWDDEDWSSATTDDEPPSTRELDLHADDVAPPKPPDRDGVDRDVADLAAVSVVKGADTEPETADPESADHDTVDPETVDPETADPEAVDADEGASLETMEAAAVEAEVDDPDGDEPEVDELDEVLEDAHEDDTLELELSDPGDDILEAVDAVEGDDAVGVDDAVQVDDAVGAVDAVEGDDTVEVDDAGEATEEGVFTHAEVIPLVRPRQIDEDEVSAGLDPDLLATGAEMRSEPDEPKQDEDELDDTEVLEDSEGSEDVEDADDFADFTLEDYTGTATEEYAELARAMAASETEEVELAAISAEMPGLDTTLVGLDDVVDAGFGVTETLSTTRRSDLGLRVATAIGLLIVFLGSLLWPWAIGGLILVIFGVAALELYIVTVNAGFRPLTWAGLVGVAGALVGTWVWGIVAVPIALALTAIGATLFLALSAERRTPLLDLALTIAMMAWIGVLGAPAFAIVDAPEYRWLILAVVLTTAFMDVAQYFVGRALGRRPLSPVVSPKKTVEGLVGGVFAALIVGVAFGSIEASPFDPGSGLAFGAMVAVVAPLGDLAVSVVKRALDVKDMSAILPGHGGIMDRIDAMVFVIPSAWILFRYFDLLG